MIHGPTVLLDPQLLQNALCNFLHKRWAIIWANLWWNHFPLQLYNCVSSQILGWSCFDPSAEMINHHEHVTFTLYCFNHVYKSMTKYWDSSARGTLKNAKHKSITVKNLHQEAHWWEVCKDLALLLGNPGQSHLSCANHVLTCNWICPPSIQEILEYYTWFGTWDIISFNKSLSLFFFFFLFLLCCLNWLVYRCLYTAQDFDHCCILWLED